MLAPWKLWFSLEPRRAGRYLDASADSAEWLTRAATLHDEVRVRNKPVVSRLDTCSGMIASLLVLQTVAWPLALGVG